MEGTMAVVTCFAGDFQPRYWALCSGQTLAIAQNQALFSLLGTTYGGNGVTTFMLPDLRGRTAIGQGQGSGLSNYTLGQVGGNSAVTLIPNNLPTHLHNGPVQLRIQCNTNPGGETSPDAMYPAATANGYSNTTTVNIALAAPAYSGTMQNSGGGQPFSVMPPYLGMNYIICLQGIFPSRN